MLYIMFDDIVIYTWLNLFEFTNTYNLQTQSYKKNDSTTK